MKAVIRTMLVLFVAGSGMAWADGSELVDLPAAPAREAVEVEPTVAEIGSKPAEDPTVEDLELLENDEVEVCNDCFGQCDYENQMCLNNGYPPPTCRAQQRECERACK